MVIVFPGVPLTRAKDFLPRRVFMSDDFPTFDRPENAICGMASRGNCDGKPADILRFTSERLSTVDFSFGLCVFAFA